MKWQKMVSQYEYGQIRVVRRFLFFPLCLQGEYRWLMRTRIKQEYYFSHLGDVWVSVGWAND